MVLDDSKAFGIFSEALDGPNAHFHSCVMLFFLLFAESWVNENSLGLLYVRHKSH